MSGTSTHSGVKRFRYDKAGNRTQIGDDGIYGQEQYNNVNQLLERNQVSSEGKLDVLFSGTTERPADVWVAKKRARGYANNYFETELKMSTGSHNVEVMAIDAVGRTTTNTYSVNVQAVGTPTSYTYDADGNMTANYQYVYEWDALSRLVSVREK